MPGTSAAVTVSRAPASAICAAAAASGSSGLTGTNVPPASNVP